MSKKGRIEKVLDNSIRLVKKKHHKKVLWLIFLIAITLTLVFIITNIFTKFTTEEISIDLSTEKINNTLLVKYDVKSNRDCKTTCNWKITDLSSNNLIDSGTNQNNLDKSITLPFTDSKELISAYVECKDEDCISAGTTYSDTSLITNGNNKYDKEKIDDNYKLIKDDADYIILQDLLEAENLILNPNIKIDTELEKQKIQLKKNIEYFNNYDFNKISKIDRINNNKQINIELKDKNTKFNEAVILTELLLNTTELYQYDDLLSTVREYHKGIENTDNFNGIIDSLNNIKDELETRKISKASNINNQINELEGLFSKYIWFYNGSVQDLSYNDYNELCLDILNFKELLDTYNTNVDYIKDKQEQKNLEWKAKNLSNYEPFRIDHLELNCELIKDNKIEPYIHIKLKPTSAKVNSNLTFTLPYPQNKCCIFNQCYECESKTPVILLHGHSFNKKASPFQSLNTFSKFQSRMDNYVNAAANMFSLATYEAPMSVRSTYYQTNVYSFGKYSFYTQKDDKIENYAINLKETIDLAKKESGSDKVSIVAHSMGGLVLRKYIDLFGDDSLDKIVFIAVPHHGLDPKTQSLCYLAGAKKECLDMNSNSLFFKKLNDKITVPTLNIYGNGCDRGDGVVSMNSAKLDFGNEVIVDGKCDDVLGVSLHLDLLNPDKYPIVLNSVQDFLK